MTWDEALKGISDKNAEIEQLKENHQLVRNALDAADTKLLEHEALIIELCDALEEEYGSCRGDGHMSNLLIRARDSAR